MSLSDFYTLVYIVLLSCGYFGNIFMHLELEYVHCITPNAQMHAFFVTLSLYSSSRDCPIFYRRKKAQKDMAEAKVQLDRWSFWNSPDIWINQPKIGNGCYGFWTETKWRLSFKWKLSYNYHDGLKMDVNVMIWLKKLTIYDQFFVLG